MPVLIRSEYPGRCPCDQSRLRRAAEILLTICGRDDSELSLLLVDDSRMHALNQRYRGKDKPTNVLSFPMSDQETPDPASCWATLSSRLTRHAGKPYKRRSPPNNTAEPC